jgi:Predicted acetyltransferase
LFKKFGHGDAFLIEPIIKTAFPEEDLWPLVTELLLIKEGVLCFGEVSETKAISFACLTEFSAGANQYLCHLMAPVAVHKDQHGKGHGRALINHAIEMSQRQNGHRIVTLGDPNLYGHFGFKTDDMLLPPYELPDEYVAGWQSIDATGFMTKGPLSTYFPAVWMKPELWLP